MDLPTKRIWLIGGTHEAVELAIALCHLHIPCTISVTSKSACMSYPPHPCLRVIVDRFSSSKLQQFLHQESIVAILDVSHPFAVEISQLAITMAAQTQIPYLRYERPTLMEHGFALDPQVLELDSLSTLFNGEHLSGQRVLLTLGSKALTQFQPWQNQSTLFARILPSPVALQAALAAGFRRDRIFALHPPVPEEVEMALWKHWQISLVVTKASGQAGGEAIKRRVAATLGVKLVVIKRPPIAYPHQTSTMNVALDFCVTAMEFGSRLGHATTTYG